MDINENYLKTNAIIYKGDLSIVKGLQLKERGDILINLSAQQFKIPEEIFVKEVTDTITHELIHKLIEQNSEDIYTLNGEEKTCIILANQCEVQGL